MADNVGEKRPRSRSIHRKFERDLVRMTKEIKKIVKGVTKPEEVNAAVIKLRKYEELIESWATNTAATMVKSADTQNARDWEKWTSQTKGISDALKLEIVKRPQTSVAHALIKKAADLIKSLPASEADKVVAKAEEFRAGGIRSSELVAFVQDRGEVSESRARLIARTEVSRAGTILTQSRSESIGSTHYIWRTSEDGIVRDSHRKMNGWVIAWNDPPIVDGIVMHAGAGPNCRCYPEPVIPEEFGLSAETPPSV